MKSRTQRTKAPRQRTPGRPIALSADYWYRSKEKGDLGEEAVFGYFERQRIPFQRFTVPNALSLLPLSEEERIRFASEFKKEFFIDGLARIDETAYAIEVKWKSYENFVVDVEDYDRLFELSKVIPVLVPFYIRDQLVAANANFGSIGSIHFHDVRNPKREPPLNTETQQGEPVYRIPPNELRQVFPVVK